MQRNLQIYNILAMCYLRHKYLRVPITEMESTVIHWCQESESHTSLFCPRSESAVVKVSARSAKSPL